MDISVVIPVYGCKAAIPALYNRLVCTLESIVESFEIILVEDACPQHSWDEIVKLCNKDKRVVGIHFSRNFGQISAITAGLEKSKGNFVVVMDCDLQDRPEAIKELYGKIMEGYDVVFARRLKRKDDFITKLLSSAFYKVYGYLTDGVYDDTICNFSILKRKVVDSYCNMREHNRAFTMFVRWLGFKETSINLEAESRYEGKSSYTLNKKVKLAMGIITSQSNKPLLFAVKLGFYMTLFSFLYIIYLIVRQFVLGDVLIGWTTIVASIYLIGGLTIGVIGVVGIYIGNIFDEVKNRPLYIITEELNSGDDIQ